jgi:hypothetical protein
MNVKVIGRQAVRRRRWANRGGRTGNATPQESSRPQKKQCHDPCFCAGGSHPEHYERILKIETPGAPPRFSVRTRPLTGCRLVNGTAWLQGVPAHSRPGLVGEIPGTTRRSCTAASPTTGVSNCHRARPKRLSAPRQSVPFPGPPQNEPHHGPDRLSLSLFVNSHHICTADFSAHRPSVSGRKPSPAVPGLPCRHGRHEVACLRAVAACFFVPPSCSAARFILPPHGARAH